MKYFHQPSVMGAQQHFSHVPSAQIQRSRFDRSHGLKTTFDAGYLVPIYVDEVLPGDTFHLKETSFCRLATPLRPIMDNLYYETFYFFVPYRLLWDNWQRFMGERTSPTDDPSDLTLPVTTINLDTLTSSTLHNYLGIPINGAGTVTVSALPYRAYALIFNEWFRDENLNDPYVLGTGDGPDDWGTFGVLAKRGKRHDYFTSALPWPQKGDPVMIPVGDVVSSNTVPVFKSGSTSVGQFGAAAAGNNAYFRGTAPGADAAVTFGSETGLMIDLDPAATGATINDLRTAFQIQRLLERDARGGTRYIELILSHFGVRSPDARLQRPEYLGGSSARININPVAATYHNDQAGGAAQGELAGFGTVVNRGGFSKGFTEHGIILGLANVRADLTYQQGLEKFWSRRTRYDFYWPALANLGEQAILNKEIFLSGSAAAGVDDTVWGYQERYAEYRYKPSRISGKFLSSDPESLDVWHLAQDFSALPPLNSAFIQDAPPLDRIVAVPGEPHMLCDVWFSLQCERPMPVYSVPGMVDHF